MKNGNTIIYTITNVRQTKIAAKGVTSKEQGYMARFRWLQQIYIYKAYDYFYQ